MLGTLGHGSGGTGRMPKLEPHDAPPTHRGVDRGACLAETDAGSGACRMPCHAPTQSRRHDIRNPDTSIHVSRYQEINMSRSPPETAMAALDCKAWSGGASTYSMANLRGFTDKTGNRKKQITKQAKAPRLQAAKTSSRSHRLTVAQSWLASQGAWYTIHPS